MTGQKRVAVIGGSGFIGTRLIALLKDRGVPVSNIDLARSEQHSDVTSIVDVRSAVGLTAALSGHDVIVNLAAAHRDDVRPFALYTEVNVDGARALAAAAEANSIKRIVFTSSVAVYGLDEGSPSEGTRPQPFNEYGRTKLEAERILRAWAEADPSRSLMIVRPSVVFGEGNRGNVYNLARQVASRRFLMVGKGLNRKSMSYVGNVVEYLARSLVSAPGVTVVNYADKPDLSTAELLVILRKSLALPPRERIRLPLALGLTAGYVLDAVARVTGRTFPISAVRIRKFAADTTVNTDRLQASGFIAPYSLEEALERTIAAEFPTTERQTP